MKGTGAAKGVFQEGSKEALSVEQPEFDTRISPVSHREILWTFRWLALLWDGRNLWRSLDAKERGTD